jgi:hypothetical protein
MFNIGWFVSQQFPIGISFLSHQPKAFQDIQVNKNGSSQMQSFLCQ